MNGPPSASSAIVSPPDADPVSAARMLVASASDTSGPPPIDSTQSRTTSNAGIAATTAPKPTRLATLSTGSTEAFAPASTVSRSAGRRRRLIATSVTMAQRQREQHRPHAADRSRAGAAPALAGEERQVEARQHQQRRDAG